MTSKSMRKRLRIAPEREKKIERTQEKIHATCNGAPIAMKAKAPKIALPTA